MVEKSPVTMASMSSASWTLTFPEDVWVALNAHLFPGDREEHGAVLLAGVAEGRDGLRLIAKELVAAEEGTDYVTGQYGYRALTPLFIAKAARRARDESLAYLAVHCHGGADRVAFSAVDMASHERGYPSLVQIVGRPVGGVVVAQNAIAGDLWCTNGERLRLASARVLGATIEVLTPERHQPIGNGAQIFDRQARLFGVEGQHRFGQMRVAIVGLGGAGSMAAEMLARLGVGELVLIDPDRVEPSNLPRIVGSRHHHAWPVLARSRFSSLRRLARRYSAFKTDVAARAIRRAGFTDRVLVKAESVTETSAALELTRCDWIVLAADTQLARHVVNAVVHAYGIPATQVGVKVPVDPDSGVVGDIFVVARRVLPSSGCLWCNGLIDPTDLQLEALGEEGDRARDYVGGDAPAPSVITLNGMAVSIAMTDLMLSVTGLTSYADDGGPSARYSRYLPRTGRWYRDEPRRDPDCPYCGRTAVSIRSKGSAARLPLPLAPMPARRTSS